MRWNQNLLAAGLVSTAGLPQSSAVTLDSLFALKAKAAALHNKLQGYKQQYRISDADIDFAIEALKASRRPLRAIATNLAPEVTEADPDAGKATCTRSTAQAQRLKGKPFGKTGLGGKQREDRSGLFEGPDAPVDIIVGKDHIIISGSNTDVDRAGGAAGPSTQRGQVQLDRRTSTKVVVVKEIVYLPAPVPEPSTDTTTAAGCAAPAPAIALPSSRASAPLLISKRQLAPAFGELHPSTVIPLQSSYVSDYERSVASFARREEGFERLWTATRPREACLSQLLVDGAAGRVAANVKASESSSGPGAGHGAASASPWTCPTWALQWAGIQGAGLKHTTFNDQERTCIQSYLDDCKAAQDAEFEEQARIQAAEQQERLLLLAACQDDQQPDHLQQTMLEGDDYYFSAEDNQPASGLQQSMLSDADVAASSNAHRLQSDASRLASVGAADHVSKPNAIGNIPVALPDDTLDLGPDDTGGDEDGIAAEGAGAGYGGGSGASIAESATGASMPGSASDVEIGSASLDQFVNSHPQQHYMSGGTWHPHHSDASFHREASSMDDTCSDHQPGKSRVDPATLAMVERAQAAANNGDATEPFLFDFERKRVQRQKEELMMAQQQQMAIMGPMHMQLMMPSPWMMMSQHSHMMALPAQLSSGWPGNPAAADLMAQWQAGQQPWVQHR